MFLILYNAFSKKVAVDEDEAQVAEEVADEVDGPLGGPDMGGFGPLFCP